MMGLGSRSNPLGYVITKLENNSIFYLSELTDKAEGEVNFLYPDIVCPSNIDVCVIWSTAVEAATCFSDENDAIAFAKKYIDDGVVEGYYTNLTLDDDWDDF